MPTCSPQRPTQWARCSGVVQGKKEMRASARPLSFPSLPFISSRAVLSLASPMSMITTRTQFSIYPILGNPEWNASMNPMFDGPVGTLRQGHLDWHGPCDSCRQAASKGWGKGRGTGRSPAPCPTARQTYTMCIGPYGEPENHSFDSPPSGHCGRTLCSWPGGMKSNKNKSYVHAIISCGFILDFCDRLSLNFGRCS